MLGDVGDDRAAQARAGVVPAEAPARGMRARVPAVAAEVGEVDAADEGDLVVDDHELLVVAVQGRSCPSRATRTPVSRASSRRLGADAAARRREDAQGAPAHSSTRTSTPRATVSPAARAARCGGSSRSSAKCGAACQPAMRTERRAPRIASAIAGSTCAPSISTSIVQPSRGAGASRHHGEPSSGGSQRVEPAEPPQPEAVVRGQRALDGVADQAVDGPERVHARMLPAPRRRYAAAAARLGRAAG